jgi:hypothetical protein
MASGPVVARTILRLRDSSSSAAESSTGWEMVKRQWKLPSEILSVLLLVGSDVVQTALAQQAGNSVLPVVFSFGWLPYMVSGTLGVAAGRALMPDQPDFPVTMINVKSGYTRENQSWVLGRVFRDFDFWRPRESIPHKIKDDKFSSTPPIMRDPGLAISVFDATHETGQLARGWDSFAGCLVASIQLGVAAIPGALHGNWAILLITGSGTLFALLASVLPQWRLEKWAYQRNSNSDICLTQGNGSHVALVIRGCGRGFNLEQMAFVKAKPLRHTVAAMSVLTALWLALLITVAGLDEDTWYLFGIGILGIVHTAVVGTMVRDPKAYGIHLQFVETLAKSRVMHTLMLAESKYPRLGQSLLTTFFPGKLMDYETEFWEEAQRRR